MAQTAFASNDTTPIAPDEPVGETSQNQESELQDIDLLTMEIPIVVTATRRKQKITNVPYAISVITAEDIRLSGARNIPDALRLVPGVDVADISFANHAVQPRGFHGLLSRSSLVLVDGRQIYDSVFGGSAWGNWPFQLEDIERIEVIRGPGGVTWGANAVNGVINIITKNPADQAGLTLKTGGGSRGWHKTHLGYGFSDERLKLRLSGEYEAGDGFRKGGSLLRNLEDDLKVGRIGLHALYEADPDDTVTISAGSALLDGGYPPPPSAGFGSKRNSGTQSNYLLAQWHHHITNDNSFNVTGYVNDFQLSPGVHAIDYRYQQLAAQFGHTFKLGDVHTFTWGIDTRVDLLDTSNADPFMCTENFVSTAILGLYLQDEWQLTHRWTLHLGGRIDYEFYGGFQPAARAALSYDLTDDSMLYGAVSRAFQMPPAGARFLNTPLLNGLLTTTADRNVRPEALIAYEFGYRGILFDRLETNLNLFWHQYDDLTILKMLPGPPGLIRSNLENAYTASLYGLELDLKYQVTERLNLLGNYTYQYAEYAGPASIIDTDYISPPKNKFMIGARYSPTDDLHLSSHLYYVDAVTAPNPGDLITRRRHVAPYFRWDLRAEYEFWNDRASVAVGVRNLLDSNHYEGGSLFLNNAEVPRMVYAEMRFRFK